jgi:hypothetical protein
MNETKNQEETKKGKFLKINSKMSVLLNETDKHLLFSSKNIIIKIYNNKYRVLLISLASFLSHYFYCFYYSEQVNKKKKKFF